MLKSFNLVLGTLLVVLSASYCALCQGNSSNHSQNIHINNGVAVQVNVQLRLRKAAAASLVDERGWMRLLTPAHDRLPPDACAGHLDSNIASLKPLAVFYGTNTSYCKSEACNIIVGRRGDKRYPLVTVHRVKGGVLIDAKVFDSNGNLIANISNDIPHINKNLVSDFARPDEHSMWVKDNHDKLVLAVRLLDKNSISIKGVFFLPDELRAPGPIAHSSVQISEESETFLPSNIPLRRNCSTQIDVVGFSDP